MVFVKKLATFSRSKKLVSVLGLIFTGFLLLSIPFCVSGDEPTKIVEYKEAIPLSAGQIRDGNVCVDLGPVMSAGEFFDGLSRHETPSGDEFRKNAQIVRNFPDEITVQVQTTVSICDADIYKPAPLPAFVNGMRFKVQWKRGLAMRPVAQFKLQRIPFTADESDNRMLFLLKIHDTDVPLTDHLIITAITPQGKMLSRMSGKL